MQYLEAGNELDQRSPGKGARFAKCALLAGSLTREPAHEFCKGSYYSNQTWILAEDCFARASTADQSNWVCRFWAQGKPDWGDLRITHSPERSGRATERYSKASSWFHALLDCCWSSCVQSLVRGHPNERPCTHTDVLDALRHASDSADIRSTFTSVTSEKFRDENCDFFVEWVSSPQRTNVPKIVIQEAEAKYCDPEAMTGADIAAQFNGEHSKSSKAAPPILLHRRKPIERAISFLSHSSRDIYDGCGHAQPQILFHRRLLSSFTTKVELRCVGTWLYDLTHQACCVASRLTEKAITLLSNIDQQAIVAIRDLLERLLSSTDMISPSGRFHRTNELVAYGSSRDVYAAYDTQTGARLCWFQRIPQYTPRESERCLQRSLDLFRSLDHPRILRVIEGWIARDQFGCAQDYCYITEWIAGGDLEKVLQHMGSVSPEVVLRWSTQILEALDFLHSMTPPIVHRDLKPANILIDHRSGDVVLGDFGRSLRLGEHDQCASLIDGTREYMAAELLEGRITTNADVYAFGMTLLHILTQERPYSECGSLEEIEERVVAGTLPEALDRLPSGAFRDTILDCLQPLETRPSSSDLLQRFRSLSSTQTVSELDH
jgi:hypothetical protein